MYLQGFIILHKTLTFITCIGVQVSLYLLHNNKLKVMIQIKSKGVIYFTKNGIHFSGGNLMFVDIYGKSQTISSLNIEYIK